MVRYHTVEVKVERERGVVSASVRFKKCLACRRKGTIAEQRGRENFVGWF